MNDLIDRDKLFWNIDALVVASVEMFRDDVLQAIQDAPSIPAEVVRHGRWMIHHYDIEKYEYTEIPYNPKTFNPWGSNMYCSICKGDALCNEREEQVPSSRCPACGARMDGQGEGDAE